MKPSDNKKLIAITLVFVLLGLSNLNVTTAQSLFTEEQKRLIQDLQTSINHFQQLTSYRFTGDYRSNEQTVSNSDGKETRKNQAVYQKISGQFVKKPNSTDIQVELRQQITLVGEDDTAPFVGDTTQQFDAIVVDNQFYLRFSNITPFFNTQKFPKGWARIDQLPEFSGSEFLNLDTYFRIFASQMIFPINEQSILSIQELPVQRQNDQTEVRGIKVIFDSVELFKTSQFDKLISTFNIDPSATVETQRELLGKDSTHQVIYWMGIEDQMIYRTDLASVIGTNPIPIVSTSSSSVIINQMIGNSISFADFNQPIEIKPPIE